MLEVVGDSSRDGRWALVRLTLDGDRIASAEAEGLERPLEGLTLLEAAAVGGETLAADGGQDLRRTPDFTPFLNQMFGKDVMDQVRAGKPPQGASRPSMALGG